MFLAIIDDNWGLAIGTFLFLFAMQTSPLWAKILLIALGLLCIIMNIWKGWFSFRSMPMSDNDKPSNK